MDPREVMLMLIEDHLSGTADVEDDLGFLLEAAKEFYVVTRTEALELLEHHFGLKSLPPEFDEICARIGFLRATNALARHKMGKSWRPARTMSS